MPVRDGRWISEQKLAAEEAERRSTAQEEPNDVAEAEADKPKRTRRSSKQAAEAAIFAATSVAVDLED